MQRILTAGHAHRHLTHGRGRQHPAGGCAATVRAEQPLNERVGGGSEGGGRASQASGTNPSQFAARRLSAYSKFHCDREQASSGGGEATLLSTASPSRLPLLPPKGTNTREIREGSTRGGANRRRWGGFAAPLPENNMQPADNSTEAAGTTLRAAAGRVLRALLS